MRVIVLYIYIFALIPVFLVCALFAFLVNELHDVFKFKFLWNMVLWFMGGMDYIPRQIRVWLKEIEAHYNEN